MTIMTKLHPCMWENIRDSSLLLRYGTSPKFICRAFRWTLMHVLCTIPYCKIQPGSILCEDTLGQNVDAKFTFSEDLQFQFHKPMQLTQKLMSA